MRLRVKLGMLVELLWGARECSSSDWTLLNSVTGESLYAVKAIDCSKTKITDEAGSGCINFTQTKTYRSPWQLCRWHVQFQKALKVCPTSKCVWPQLEWQQTQAVVPSFILEARSSACKIDGHRQQWTDRKSVLVFWPSSIRVQVSLVYGLNATSLQRPRANCLKTVKTILGDVYWITNQWMHSLFTHTQ